MPQPAKVTSIEALDDFKANLIVYLEKAGRLLDEISEDVVRTRIWLETDRQLHWKKLVHHRSEEHTSELQSQSNLVCRLLLEKKKKITTNTHITQAQLTHQRHNACTVLQTTST